MSASKVPAATLSRTCRLTSQTSLSETVNNAPQIGSVPHSDQQKGLVPPTIGLPSNQQGYGNGDELGGSDAGSLRLDQQALVSGQAGAAWVHWPKWNNAFAAVRTSSGRRSRRTRHLAGCSWCTFAPAVVRDLVRGRGRWRWPGSRARQGSSELQKTAPGKRQHAVEKAQPTNPARTAMKMFPARSKAAFRPSRAGRACCGVIPSVIAATVGAKILRRPPSECQR